MGDGEGDTVVNEFRKERSEEVGTCLKLRNKKRWCWWWVEILNVET